MFCARCGRQNPTGAFCMGCGAQLVPPMPTAQVTYTPPPVPRTTGSSLSSAAIALGISALFFLPIILGPIGIALAATAMSKGESRGPVALGVSIGGMVLGFIFGAAFAGGF